MSEEIRIKLDTVQSAIINNLSVADNHLHFQGSEFVGEDEATTLVVYIFDDQTNERYLVEIKPHNLGVPHEG